VFGRTLEVLELDKILRLLAEEASFGPGRDAALALAPSTDPTVVDRAQRETSQASLLLDSGESVPLGGLRDIRPLLERAAAGDLLEPVGLLDLAQTCAGAARLRRFLSSREERCPQLAALASELGAFPGLIEAIGRCINDRAEVADTASRKLADIRGATKVALGRVREKLDAIIRSAEYRKVLQDPVITLRQDRYVVPVRSEYKDALPGVVHDRSASGVTLFVEPLSVVPLNNQLRELALEERDEIARILRELTDAVLQEAAGLRRTILTLGYLDLCFAKSRLSARQSASAPLLDPRGRLDLRQARHPLLAVPPPGRVVPIDVRLGHDFDTMVITGPNTGGKTVTLKTVGLLTLMAMCGLHIPAAEGSVVPVFRGVWADIGDEQSIEQNLSTFSSHLGNIIGIIARLEEAGGDGQLVLLDEIGAGTDPAEGAALAMALLEHFHTSGAHTIATTHYSEIKAFVYEREGMVNASVEFDVETLAPTFRLMTGLPGRSNALEISNRLGLKREVVEQARAFLRAEERHDVPALIQRLEEDRVRVGEELRVAREAAGEAREMREEQARKWANLRVSEEKALERAREEAREVVRRARLEAAGVLARLRETEARLAAFEAGEAPEAETAVVPGLSAPATPLPIESRRRLDRLEQLSRDILGEAEKRTSRLVAEAEGDLVEAPGEVATGPAGEAATPGGRGRRKSPRSTRPGVGRAPEPGAVRPGQTYYVAGLRHYGQILESPDEGGMVSLLVGSMRLTVHVGDLRLPGEAGIPSPPSPRRSELSALAAAFPDAAEASSSGASTRSLWETGVSGSGTALEKAFTISTEISLRGLIVEEALARLEKYLDDAVLANLGMVRVIHGKGTGVLRQAVGEYLDEHPDVRSHYIAPQSEGGLGVTIALLGQKRPATSGPTASEPTPPAEQA
jgi:DNA mismatch repair protein MutS2